MISAGDRDRLLAYLAGELPEADSAFLEQRLSREPELADMLIELSHEEAGLREWAQQCHAADEIVRESQRQTGASRYLRGLLVTAAFFFVPPLVVAATIWMLADYGLGLTAWAEDLHQQFQRSLGVFGSAAALCWLGLRRAGWLSQPLVAGIGGAATLVGITISGQLMVSNYADAENLRRAQLFQEHTWISYDSAYYWPPDLEELTGRPPQEPTLDQIRRELALLHEAGFTGLYLHECRTGQRDVPRIAREVGFGAVIVAIRVADPLKLDAPDTQQQVENALAAASYVDALCFGELSAREVDLAALKRQLARLRSRTGKPVTTSFLDTDYAGKRGERLRDLADFTVRGLRRPWQDGRGDVDRAVEAVRTALDSFREDDKPSLLTFVYFPTGGGPGFTEHAQREFFRKITELPISHGTNFVVFNSFDRPWAERLSEVSAKTPAFEGHTGVFAARLSGDGREIVFTRKQVIEVFAGD